jgi:putative membrane protein
MSRGMAFILLTKTVITFPPLLLSTSLLRRHRGPPFEMNTLQNKKVENLTNSHKPSANDHLANERTFLAWIRTSIAIMGFGFVVVKFSLFIRQLSFALGETNVLPGKGYSPVIGIALVIIGSLMALLAFIRYRNIENHLAKGTYFPSFVLSLLVTLAILIVSPVLILYLVQSI